MDSSANDPSPRQPASSARTSSSENALDEGDRRLLRWMLELTATERLRVAEGFANDVLKLRNARQV